MEEQVNIHEAKTHFSKLISQATEGHEIVIAKAGKPVAKLIPYAPVRKRRFPGSSKGTIVVKDDFEHPLPEEILEGFLGRSGADERGRHGMS